MNYRSLQVAIGALALTACHTAHVADFIATPADRLVCEAAGPRPKIPAEYQIDWTKIATVDQAKSEVVALITRQHERESVVAGYVLQTEGKLETCFLNMNWRRQYEAELAKSHPKAN
jgi:hypothetical protein